MKRKINLSNNHYFSSFCIHNSTKDFEDKTLEYAKKESKKSKYWSPETFCTMCPMAKFNALPCQWQNINKYCTICWIRIHSSSVMLTLFPSMINCFYGSFIICTPLLFSLVTILLNPHHLWHFFLVASDLTVEMEEP